MVDVILPVLNEAAAIPSVLRRMPFGFDPIVVDNGSTDGSRTVAARFGARVVVEESRGFGAACHAGLEAASSEFVCFMDCDGSLDPRALPGVADPVVRGTADLALGRRCPQPGAWPLHARVSNLALMVDVRRRTGTTLRDIGPMRAAARLPLLELGISDRRFGWPLEMVIKASEAGWRILEIPVGYAPRAGRSKVTGTLRGTVQTVRDMAKVMR